MDFIVVSGSTTYREQRAESRDIDIWTNLSEGAAADILRSSSVDIPVSIRDRPIDYHHTLPYTGPDGTCVDIPVVPHDPAQPRVLWTSVGDLGDLTVVQRTRHTMPAWLRCWALTDRWTDLQAGVCEWGSVEIHGGPLDEHYVGEGLLAWSSAARVVRVHRHGRELPRPALESWLEWVAAITPARAAAIAQGSLAERGATSLWAGSPAASRHIIFGMQGWGFWRPRYCTPDFALATTAFIELLERWEEARAA